MNHWVWSSCPPAISGMPLSKRSAKSCTARIGPAYSKGHVVKLKSPESWQSAQPKPLQLGHSKVAGSCAVGLSLRFAQSDGLQLRQTCPHRAAMPTRSLFFQVDSNGYPCAMRSRVPKARQTSEALATWPG